MADSAPASRILVVDDDEGFLILLAETLRAEGYVVDTADSGALALAQLVEQPPDLMLLDLKLKDVGGPALVERLRQIDARVPFVVVTGQGDEKVAVEVMKQGALDYVMKNTALLDLLPEVVRRALAATAQERALTAAQASLRESVERFSAAVRATNDGVWEWHLQSGRCYYSDRWKEILGYRPDEIGEGLAEWLERVHPEDSERLAKAQEACYMSFDTSFNIEYRMRHRDGSYRWILCRALLDRESDGRPLRFIGAQTDITENKQLEEEILAISEREQRRIGQDLHDGLGQQLTAIELMAHSIKGDLETVRPDLAAQMGRLGSFLREAISQTRSLAHGLTAFMLDASGLQSTLADLAQRTRSVSRVACRFECPTPVQLEDPVVAGHLFRIAQEAVANALKHAQAREIVITLSGTASVVVLEITDDGRGLSREKRSSHGIGLQVMRHRANAIGADLTVTSAPEAGTTVRCTLHRHA
jgi:PAS domain S-box-containing protein